MQTELEFGANPGVTLFGVGGAGGNAVGRLFRRPDPGMKIICANTDMQALRAAPSACQLQLGRTLTRGLGAGANPEIGRAAAEEAMPDIVRALEGTSLCFIAAGMGGGTGTGAAPVIARAARERGILTIGVATKPFAFEGKRRAHNAAVGAALFEGNVDAMVVVCNEHLFRIIGKGTTFRAALELSDSVICESATDFAALVAGPALKRVTVADMRSALKSGGRAVIGYGERCAGPDRATAAAASALRNPLLENVARGAQRLLVTVAGGSDLGLFEVEEAIAHLQENVHPSVELVWGSVMDPALDGRVRVGIVAAGLPHAATVAAPVQTIREKIKATPTVRGRPVEPALFIPMAPKLPECTPVEMATPPEPVAPPVPAIVPPPAEMPGPFTRLPRATPERTIGPNAIPVVTAPIHLNKVDSATDELVLTSSYDLETMANRVRSRSSSASLVDRVYFATRDLKRNWQQRAEPPILATMPRPPRTARVLQTASM